MQLLPGNTQLFWTVHSARATLPSWAAVAGFQPADVDRAMRHGAGGPEGHVRTQKECAIRIQCAVAEGLRDVSAGRTRRATTL